MDATTTSAIVTALSSGLSDASGEALAAIAQIVPVGVLILGAFAAIRAGIKTYKVFSKNG